MIIKHVLSGSDDAVRYAQTGWTVASVVTLLVFPVVARRLDHLGKVFLVLMILDGAVLAIAGRQAVRAGMTAILPFASIMAIDRSLTDVNGALISVAQNGWCGSTMRGRVAAAFAFFVLIGDLFAEGLATTLSEAVGMPGTLITIGLAQVVIMVAVAGAGGCRLWRFGLTSAPPSRYA